MNSKIILCVDDEVIVLNSLKEQLQNEFVDNFSVEIAENYEDAISIVEEEIIENKNELIVAIVDYLMPGIKGDELLIKIHEISPFTKKILLTGQANIEGVANAINKANLYRFLTKPWNKEDLMLTVKEAIKSYEQEKTIFKQNKELLELNIDLENKIEERTKELKEINEAKDRLFSILAHDLRNPLNSIIGLTDIILSNFQEYDNKQLYEFTLLINQSAHAIHDLLENILEWAKTQMSKVEVKPDYNNLFELTQETIENLEIMAKLKKISILNNISPVITFYGDKNMIKTILRNLIYNAIKFTNEYGKILIGCNDKGQYLEVYIKDNGIGIHPEKLEKLFKYNTDIVSYGTHNEKGIGIGLVLCKDLIEKNKGKIYVESILGEGSTFYFTLHKNAETFNK